MERLPCFRRQILYTAEMEKHSERAVLFRSAVKLSNMPIEQELENYCASDANLYTAGVKQHNYKRSL
jgi:hypothetical protein